MTNEKKFNNIEDYADTVSKQNRGSTLDSAPIIDDELNAKLLSDLETQGYVIIENLLASELVAKFKNEIMGLLGPTGRHGFEGFQTQRIYSLLQKTLVCNPLVEHPFVLAIIDQLLLPNYLLSHAVAINIMPGQEQQLIHHDDAFYQVARPRKALSVAAMWALDDFTAENGGTMVIPGSHLWEDRQPTQQDLEMAVPVIMPAGSACFFLGTLWHKGGANNADTSRLGVTAQYCEPWCRPVENTFLTIPVESVKQCSKRLQSLLGYSLHGPFMGYVDDARHPGIRLKD